MTTPIKDPAVEAARVWIEGEIRTLELAASRAIAFQRVIGHQAAANHLTTFLAGHATQAQALADALGALKPFAEKIVDIGQDETDEDHFSNARSPYNQAVSVKVGDIRRAALAYKAHTDTGEQS